jgi:metal-responsive CopG/Arc/MetJ family transcriptional regulator
MTVAKVAISLDQRLLQKLDSLVANRIFRSRSEAIQTAVKEKIIRLEHTRLAQECAKLDPIQEQKLADEGVVNELSEWPEY